MEKGKNRGRESPQGPVDETMNAAATNPNPVSEPSQKLHLELVMGMQAQSRTAAKPGLRARGK